ncbi:VOC family protein [Rhizobium sp. L1K21]|nr:VOC family protein [Rhizobium sp. L1K21]MCO6185347.1 VOC family protein [Rhizobium sp. L1K21]
MAVEALPVLPSLDIAETQDFYAGKLGFSNVIYRDDTYLILKRDIMELHFWLCDNRTICENTSVYLRGGGIDQLYEEFCRADIERLSDFTVRPWRMKEFYIHDPHGNLLRFGRNA